MQSKKTALVLGAKGGIGGEVMRQMQASGWTVRAFARRLNAARSPEPCVSWIEGDAMNREDVLKAAQGCSVIVHAVNPPGYRRWSELVLPMLDNTIAAAIKEKATLLLPGTVYNYGPDAFPLLTENAPQSPVTRKGAIRVEMERRLREASENGARVLIVRAGDFFGPGASNSWFSQGLVKPGKPVKTVSRPSSPGIGHAWAYLPDVAQTMLALLEKRSALDAFASFHFAGHWDASGSALADSICRVVTARTGETPRVTSFPWWLIYALSPFITTFREMLEMRYLWREPVRLDNSKLVATLGQEPHTPLDRAVEITLDSMENLGTSRSSDSVIAESRL